MRERNLNTRKYNVEKECIDEFQSGRKGCCEGASYDMYACQGINGSMKSKRVTRNSQVEDRTQERRKRPPK